MLLPGVPYIALSALVLSTLSLILMLWLNRRLSRLAVGKHGSLEETLTLLTRNTKELQSFRSDLEKYLKSAESRLRGSVQGIGVVRFNAFEGKGGGNQSFAIALLDEKLSGVVLSTLYARDRVGVYAKPILEARSTFELSAEEGQAIEKAKESLAAHKRT